MAKLNHQKVYVAMSGGVDSSVAALLLKRQGFEVTGVYMKNWSDPLADECPWKQDIKDFKAVCRVLEIPAKIEVFEEQYRQKIVQYLIKGYQQGVTPNPDMLCNREIKFKLFLEKARKMGADFIATGHYVIKLTKKNKHFLLKAKDANKDQSYFLALLTQKQLKYSLFPIGNLTKPEVRALAKQAGLPVYNKKDSQGICFIGKVKFKDFIRQFIKPKPGLIKTVDNRLVGRHDGLSFYTIGQRHGLGIGGGAPFYVTAKDKKTNTLYVSTGKYIDKLYSKIIMANKISWINGWPPKLPFSCQARIRYRQPLVSCRVIKKSSDKIRVSFSRPQRAVTPGQFIVFYKARKMLGGAVII